LARLLPNGLVDSSFQIGTGVNGTVHSITVLPGGKILISGNFTSVNGNARSRVARLNADGSLDQTFQPPTINATVFDVAVAGSGKIYIVGDFTTVGSSTRNRVARLNSDGTLDLTFDPGLGPNAVVNAVAVQSDGQVLIAGAFTTVSGFPSPGLARINGDPEAAAPVTISGMRIGADGRPTFQFTSEAGRNYVIESSINLITWSNVQTVTATSQSTQFVDTSAAGQMRFYRVRAL
jgi:uncharacterized delta-60 repeat protein